MGARSAGGIGIWIVGAIDRNRTAISFISGIEDYIALQPAERDQVSDLIDIPCVIMVSYGISTKICNVWIVKPVNRITGRGRVPFHVALGPSCGFQHVIFFLIDSEYVLTAVWIVKAVYRDLFFQSGGRRAVYIFCGK